MCGNTIRWLERLAMTTRRERWYCCTFTRGSHRWSTFVRAWDADQAAAELRAALGDTAERGVIAVEPARSGDVASAPAELAEL
jgi:hypothetical protein